jgi:hypothetical protein
MYLWFYEWNLFDAVRPGAHTRGRRDSVKVFDPGNLEARLGLAEEGLTLHLRAVPDGAHVRLSVVNRSGHDWPELAGIVPCFSPGLSADGGPATREFANERTWFLGVQGLDPLRGRGIHFNEKLRKVVDARSENGRHAWSEKWPTAEPDATGGVILRTSEDGRWVAGIAWEHFLSVQAHNPMRCMHLCVRLGPLRRGESRTIRGRIYLLEGTKEDVLQRYREEFSSG